MSAQAVTATVQAIPSIRPFRPCSGTDYYSRAGLDFRCSHRADRQRRPRGNLPFTEDWRAGGDDLG